MKASISEDIVVQIWQSGIFPKLETATGEKVQIIHPGRFSQGQAGDFQDAVLLIDGQKAYGNIEAHVRSSQWYSHKHHRNPRYNNIILHVVYHQDTKIPTILCNGTIIPTISLDTFLTKHFTNSLNQANAPRQSPFICPHMNRYPENERNLDALTIAGIERFKIKANSILSALRQNEPGQVLFAGISRSLGYSQNSQAFEKLASKIQLSSLEQINFGGKITQQALLMGSASLLPSQRYKQISESIDNREIIEQLEQTWKASGLNNSMDEADWCFFRVRPTNYPTRRIVALSHFLEKYNESGLLSGILNLFVKSIEEINYRQLVNSLTVPAQGYWAYHCDFNIPMVKSYALIGHNTASEILVNTALPFVYTWSRSTSEFKLERELEDLYRRLPGSADNELTIYMKRQLKITNKHLSACHQQGLIHIFKNHCRFRDCDHCTITVN